MLTWSSISGRRLSSSIVSASWPSKTEASNPIASAMPVDSFPSSIAARRVQVLTEVSHSSSPSVSSVWSPVLSTV